MPLFPPFTCYYENSPSFIPLPAIQTILPAGKVCAQADNSLPLWYNGPKMSTNLLLRPAFAEVTGVITAKKEANP